MDLVRALDDATRRLPGSYAAGLVDVDSGELLASSLADSSFRRSLEIAGAVAMELFATEEDTTGALRQGAQVLAISDTQVHLFRVCDSALGRVLVLIFPSGKHLAASLARIGSITCPDETPEGVPPT